MTLRSTALTSLLLLGVIGCNSDQTVIPDRQPPIAQPSYRIPLGSGTLGVPATNTAAAGAVDWVTMGTAPTNAFVLVQVTGGISVGKNQACDDTFLITCQAPLVGETAGPLGDASGNLIVSVKENGGYYVLLSVDSQANSASGLMLGTGKQIQASRSGISSPGGVGCGSGPQVQLTYITNCPPDGNWQSFFLGNYTLSGSQTVTLTKLDPITVSASPKRVSVGDSVIFTATLDGHANPGNLYWYWVPSDTGASPAQDAQPISALTGGTYYFACSGKTTCVYAPAKSGRMYAEDKILGVWVHAGSEAVLVSNSCPTGDSLFDNHRLRSGIADAWANTHSELGELGALEQVGFFLYDSVTRQYSYKDMTPWASTTACSDSLLSSWIYQIPIGSEVVGFFHTHPFKNGHPWKYCNNPNGQPRDSYESGPSQNDMKFLANLNYLLQQAGWLPPGVDGIYGFIADPWQGYTYKTTLDSTQKWQESGARKVYKNFDPKTAGGCP